MRGICITDLWKNPKRHGQGLRWMVRVRDPLTKRYGHARSFETRGEADAHGRRELDQFQRSVKRAVSVQWKEIGDDYVTRLRLADMGEHHAYQLQRMVDELHEAGARDVTADNFPRIVQQWLADRKPGGGPQKGVKGGTSKTHRVKLLEQAKYIINSIIPRLIQYNPLGEVKLAKPPRKAGEYYRFDEIRRLIDPGAGMSRYRWGKRTARLGRWWMFAVLGFYTAQRPTIVRNIRLEWFDFVTHSLFIPADCPGNKTKMPITVPIQKELEELLLEEQIAGRITRAKPGEEQEPLVGWVINRMMESNVTTGFGNYCKRCGVRPLGAHRVRHSAASILVASGMSGHHVMDILGHEDTQTSKSYTRGARLYAAEEPSILEWRGLFRLRSQDSTSAGAISAPGRPPR